MEGDPEGCGTESAGEQAKGTEGGGDDEEWLMAGRSKKKKAVTRGTTSIQVPCTDGHSRLLQCIEAL